jgi:hypothetical protein
MSWRQATTLPASAAMARSIAALSAAFEAEDADYAERESGAVALRIAAASAMASAMASAIMEHRTGEPQPEPVSPRKWRALTAGRQLLTIWDI